MSDKLNLMLSKLLNILATCLVYDSSNFIYVYTAYVGVVNTHNLSMNNYD